MMMNDNEPEHSPIRFKADWCIELKPSNHEEILSLQNRPTHCFGDIREFVNKSFRKAVGLDKGTELPAKQLRKLIPFSKPRLQAHCYACGKECRLTSGDLHSCGSPCTDHSSMGGQKRFDGPQAKLFYIWVSIIRCLLIRVVIHENVTQFGLAELMEFFSDLYLISLAELDCDLLGWPLMRLRQYALMILKCWIFPVLKDRSANSAGPSDQVLTIFKQELDYQRSLDHLFRRPCHMSWTDFLMASPADKESDKEWALSRKLVSARHQSAAQAEEFPDDEPGSWLWALTYNERCRYRWCCENVPNEVRDVQQNPDEFVVGSKRGRLSTIMKNTGILMTPSAPAFVEQFGPPRALHWKELMTAMGFPISAAAQAACCNTSCTFSEGFEGASTCMRSRASLLAGCGNAMHVNCIGAVHFFVVLKFPSLGRRTQEHGVDHKTGEGEPESNEASSSSLSMPMSPAAAPAPNNAHDAVAAHTDNEATHVTSEPRLSSPSKMIGKVLQLRNLKRRRSEAEI